MFRRHLSHLTTKPTKWHVHPVKTQISMGIRPVWSESSLSAWRKLGSLATLGAHSEDSDQTGWMSRLIWVFAGRTCHFVGFVMRRLIYLFWKKEVNDWKYKKWQVVLNIFLAFFFFFLTYLVYSDRNQWYPLYPLFCYRYEPPHDKTNKVTMRPAWSESSLSAHWVAKDPSCVHADSEDSDQTGRMPRLIWVFAGRTVTLLVLSVMRWLILQSCLKFYI